MRKKDNNDYKKEKEYQEYQEWKKKRKKPVDGCALLALVLIVIVLGVIGMLVEKCSGNGNTQHVMLTEHKQSYVLNNPSTFTLFFENTQIGLD